MNFSIKPYRLKADGVLCTGEESPYFLDMFCKTFRHLAVII